MSKQQPQKKKDEEAPVIVVRTRNASNQPIEEKIRIGTTPDTKARRAFVGKMVMLGDSGTGKSQFVTATRSDYNETIVSVDVLPAVSETLCVDFAILQFEIGRDTLYRMQLWDTAGQERFHSMLPMYVRDAVGIVVMFDITDRRSFDSVEERWVPFLERNLSKRTESNQVPVMLVGSKMDLENKRAVEKKEAQSFAFARGWNYAETTALVRATVHNAIADMCVNMYYSSMRANLLREIVVTPEMHAVQSAGSQPATTTRLFTEIYTTQDARKKKLGGCC